MPVRSHDRGTDTLFTAGLPSRRAGDDQPNFWRIGHPTALAWKLPSMTTLYGSGTSSPVPHGVRWTTDSEVFPICIQSAEQHTGTFHDEGYIVSSTGTMDVLHGCTPVHAWPVASPSGSLRESYWLNAQALLAIGGIEDDSATGVVDEVPVPRQERTPVFDRLAEIDPHAMATLIRLTKLESNWDGYGGLPPSATVAEKAASILLTTRKLSAAKLRGPFIAPLPDGGLELEWQRESGAELTLVIGPSYEGGVRYVLDEVRGNGVFESEGAVPRDATLSELVDRVCGNHKA